MNLPLSLAAVQKHLQLGVVNNGWFQGVSESVRQPAPLKQVCPLRAGWTIFVLWWEVSFFSEPKKA